MAVSSLKLDFLDYVVESGSKDFLDYIVETRDREKSRQLLHSPDKRW